MFGIDEATWGTVWPSLLGILIIVGAMGWGVEKALLKIRKGA